MFLIATEVSYSLSGSKDGTKLEALMRSEDAADKKKKAKLLKILFNGEVAADDDEWLLPL